MARLQTLRQAFEAEARQDRPYWDPQQDKSVQEYLARQEKAARRGAAKVRRVHERHDLQTAPREGEAPLGAVCARGKPRRHIPRRAEILLGLQLVEEG